MITTSGRRKKTGENDERRKHNTEEGQRGQSQKERQERGRGKERWEEEDVAVSAADALDGVAGAFTQRGIPC